MIAEIGLAKILAAGGGLAGGIALFAGVSGGTQYAIADKSASGLSICASAPAPTRSEPSRKSRDPRLTREQRANAQAILDTARELSLPERAAVIGVATALQESGLKNNVIGDKGRAFGVFQQHPADGWGTRAQVTDPRHAAWSFLTRLTKIKGWHTKPLTVVAQAVQRSAFPDAYAKHEARATAIVSALRSPRQRRDETHNVSELAGLKVDIQAADALGMPRADLIKAISARLREQGSHRDQPIPDVEQAAESIVRDLCDELSAKIEKFAGRALLAVQAALTMRGVPYSWGGGGPSGPGYGIGRGAGTKGFDCSGLTEYAWAQAGVRIGTTTYQQVSAGTPVPRAAVRPGDLVFYETDASRPGPDHVGLAISASQMINAPYTGAVVRIEPIDRSGWAGAVRPGVTPALRR